MTHSLTLRAALVSVLIFAAFVLAWHAVTRGTGTSAPSGARSKTCVLRVSNSSVSRKSPLRPSPPPLKLAIGFVLRGLVVTTTPSCA